MQKSISDIAIDFSSSRFLFSTMILAAAVAIIFFLIPSYLLSFFVFGAEPGMASPPPTTSPSPPAATTGEKPRSMPPSTSSPKIPSIEEKKDPKDGDTIISSKTDDGTITVATKVDKKSDKKTFNFNRGYTYGIAAMFDKLTKKDEIVRKNFLKHIMSGQALDNLLADGFTEEYANGFILGVKHALKLDDILGLIPSKKP